MPYKKKDIGYLKPINDAKKRKYTRKGKYYTIEEHYAELSDYYNTIGHIIYF